MPRTGEFGESLRGLREGRRLTPSEAARRAGIPKSTLQNWESGHSLPKGPSFPRLLDVLETEPRLRSRLLSLADPRYARVELARLPLGAPVDLGAVLRAMRTRRGTTQSGLARAAGVTQGAVARWESGDSTPTPENVHAVAHALGATAEEALALAAVGRPDEPALDWKDPEDALRRSRAAAKVAPRELRRIVGMTLEAEAWRRASRDARWDPVLGFALSNRALLEYHDRAPDLGEKAACQALTLVRTDRDRAAAMSGLDIVTTLGRRRGEDPERALGLASDWAGTLSDPLLRAWALTIRGDRLARMGRRAEATETIETIFGLILGDKSREEALKTEWEYRVDLELRTGRPREALRLLDVRPAWDGDHRRAVRVLHANGQAAPKAWMDSIRSHWRSPEAEWQDRERLGRLLRLQARLLSRSAKA